MESVAKCSYMANYPDEWSREVGPIRGVYDKSVMKAGNCREKKQIKSHLLWHRVYQIHYVENKVAV